MTEEIPNRTEEGSIVDGSESSGIHEKQLDSNSLCSPASPGMFASPGDSVRSFDEHDEDALKIKRESIRARLREREKRLTSLVRQSSSDGANSLIGQMRTVQETLQKMEQEKSEMEKELARLKHATDGDEFLQEKMTGVQEGFMKQVKVIQNLEDEIVAKNNEIDHLRDELVAKLRRIVELEFDLETHNVHYTDYAAEQFKLGEEALAEIKAMEKQGILLEDANDDLSEHSPTAAKRLAPRRAQKLISKLLADLDNLEARYKEEKLDSASKMEKLNLLNEELRTKIHILESRLGDGEKSFHDDDDESTLSAADKSNMAFLRKRVETLEAKRAIYREDMRKLHKELADIQRVSKDAVRKAEFEVDRLTLENEAMKTRIKALETDIMEGDSAVAQFSEIDRKIKISYDEIARLNAAADIKDRQIATLKKEVAKLRIGRIASKGENEEKFSEFDSELLRKDNLRLEEIEVDGPREGPDPRYVQELQRQLQSAQQQLVKKDQELVIERAKAASTAAGLLARITELTGRMKQEESGSVRSAKRGSKKNAPLRFYL